MSERPSELAELQRWMLGQITQPGGVGPAASVRSVIAPSRTLSSEERLAVYSRAYLARLLDCLRELFPAMAQLLGEDLFGEFGIGYLQEHPPHSYTLAKLADRFVAYLTATKPAASDDASVDASFELVIDLAILEQAIDEVFDGPGEEGRSMTLAEELGRVPQEEWPNLVLVPSAALRLMPLRFPLHDLYTRLRAGEEEVEFPLQESSFLALWRRDYIVQRMPLAREQFVLLSELARGQTIAEALELTAYATGLGEDAPLSDWFAKWTTLGLFVGLRR